MKITEGKTLQNVAEELYAKYNDLKFELSRKHDEIKTSKKNSVFNSAAKKYTAALETQLLSIENDLFDIKYRDTILFYGSARGYRYSLYIDGLLYDEVKSKELVVIKLSEGFHSFKLETDQINPFDSSVINTFTFETRQIIINGNEVQAYAMECDGRRLRQLPKSAFEKVTKQTFNI